MVCINEVDVEAIMMLNLDDPVSSEILEEIRAVDGINNARVIKL